MSALRARAALLVVLVLVAAPRPGGTATPPAAAAGSPARFEALMARAARERWRALPVGERAGRFAVALEGTPYAAGTLEGPGPESCRVTLDGFDCVTYVETCLDLSRVLARAGTARAGTFEDLRRAVTETRYRGGVLAGYASRLHYTADWIADNVARGVLEDITPSLGGEPLALHVGFMSGHPGLYPALRDSPALVDSLRVAERRVNGTARTYVPAARVGAIEGRLRTGDIVAITTSEAGLDYSHVGFVLRTRGGVAHFLHASSARHRVVQGERLGAYLALHARTDTGISVLRARESR